MSLVSIDNVERLSRLLNNMSEQAHQIGNEQDREWFFSCEGLDRELRQISPRRLANRLLIQFDDRQRCEMVINDSKLVFAIQRISGRFVYAIEGEDVSRYPQTVKAFKRLFAASMFQLYD